MKQYMEKYRHYILYIIFGVLTTIVNVITYYFAHLLIPVMPSTIIAWILAVLFAYVTNRRFVFESQAKTKQEIVREIISFFSARLFTGLVDFVCMFIFVDCLKINDLVIKTIANIIVIKKQPRKPFCLHGGKQFENNKKIQVKKIEN